MIKNNNYKIVYILENKTLKRYINNKDIHFRLFRELNKNYKFYIINISNIMKTNTADIKNLDDFNYVIPNNMDELNKFFSKYKILASVKIPIDLKFHKIFRCLKKNKVKLFSFSNLVFSYEDNYSFILKTRKFFNILKLKKMINYYVFRILILLELYPRISYHFECDQRRIDQLKNSQIFKFQKIFSILKISYYEKIIRINSKYYSEIINKNYKITDEYIVVCDTPMSHPDITVLEGRKDKNLIENYYFKLHSFLKHIENTFRKNVILCLHPKGEYENFKNFNLIKKDFKTTMYETSYYIRKAFFVLFQTSNTINDAIILNKPIIQINSELLSDITKKKLLDFNKQLNCSMINIEESNKINADLYNKIKSETKNYNIYRENRLIFEKKKKDLDQLIYYINTQIIA